MKILVIAHFLLYIWITMHTGMATGKEAGQPIPSCDKCAPGLENLMTAIENPTNLSNRRVLEKIFGAPFIQMKTTRLNGSPADYYSSTISGPPRMIINWALNNPGDFIVIFSLNAPYMPPNTLGNMDNCVHPSDFKSFEDLGWQTLGIEDAPTSYAQHYHKGEYRLDLNYSPRYRCLSSAIISKK